MTFRIGLICALAATGLFAADQPQVRVVEEIVAKVNSDIITRGELAKVHEELAVEIQQTSGLTGTALQDAIDRKSGELLQDQIDQLLLVQKGKELNINVDG